MNKSIDPALMQAAEAAGSTLPAAMAASMGAYWMPFTANRQFKKAPRLLTKSQGMHYWDMAGDPSSDAIERTRRNRPGEPRPRSGVKRIARPASPGRPR